ncbi:MAG TPA: DUF348 domain-containing protein [Candidatus Moranbacteria bacterium]|nr:DUF348 domain-containing protein [Candidatus Moranbacteria bacterium]
MFQGIKNKTKISLLIAVLLFSTKVSTAFFGKRQLDFSGEKEVILSDNGLVYQSVKTKALTVKEFIQENKLDLHEEDQVYPRLDDVLLPGTNIQIMRSVPVEILVDGGRIQKRVFAKDVTEALGEAGVSLAPLDKINLTKSAPLVSGAKIEVTRIEIEDVEEEERIDFEIKEKEDPKVKWRTKEIKQKGIAGKKIIKYQITYKNGEQVSKKKVSEKITQRPVDEIVSVGTKVTVGKTQAGRASWYAHTGTMACASVKFPKGAWLRVTAKNTGKQIFVQVNDYGPDPGTGKIIDLDKVAFERLAPVGAGVVDVKVEEILE